MDIGAALKQTMDTGEYVAMAYLNDLSDADLLKRPHPACNHILWQIGHLILSEHQMVEGVLPGSMPPLPAGFADRYTSETAKSDDPATFDTREALMQAYRQQRAASIAKLQSITPDEFARQSPESMRSYAPNVAAVFSLQGGHWLMHAGQWAVLRRQLGRPPLF